MNRHICMLVAMCVTASVLVAQPVVPTTLVGKTYYEKQSLGTIGHLIAQDPVGGLDFCWTSSNSTGLIRHTYYNYLQPDGILIGDSTGVALDAEYSGAYANMSLFPDGRCVAVFHGGAMGSTHSYIYYDVLLGVGAFQPFEIPNDPTAGVLISPHVGAQADAGHVAAVGMGMSGFSGLYYTRLPFEINFSFNNWTLVDTPKVIAQDIAISPVSNRVALVWPHQIGEAPGYPDIQVDNDIYAVISEDGSTWNFASPLNITDFLGGEPPHSDSVRGYNDLSAVFDYDDYLHVAYVVVGFWFEGGEPVTTWGSMIYHWDEYSDTHTIITGNIYAEGDPGDPNASIYCKPNLGVDPASGNIYCTWVEFSDPADTADNGYLNGDVYASGSADGGTSWGTPVNLTNTSTPGAGPGDCLSENYPSLASWVNDTLHVFYQEDLYGGRAEFEDPQSVTLNPLRYLRIPASMVPVGGAGVSEALPVQPGDFRLEHNYPNPFNPSTTIEFTLPEPGSVSLIVYNITGRVAARLLEEALTSGHHSVRWNAENMPSGIYFYTLRADGYSLTRKMVLLK
jgi:hypothetical protein